MKRVTGNNTSSAAKKVSIQLRLGGHSFSPEGLDPGAERITIELLTPRSMLVPQEVFDPTEAEALLTANGMTCAEGECAVWSDSEQPVIALMAFPTQEIEAIRDQLGTAAAFTSPLLREPPLDPPTVWVYAATNLLYIKVYAPALRFAEVIAVADDDLLYYTEVLNRRFPLELFRIRIEGDDTKRLRDIFSKYSRQIR